MRLHLGNHQKGTAAIQSWKNKCTHFVSGVLHWSWALLDSMSSSSSAFEHIIWQMEDHNLFWQVWWHNLPGWPREEKSQRWEMSLQQWRSFPFYYCLLTVDCLSHSKYKRLCSNEGLFPFITVCLQSIVCHTLNTNVSAAMKIFSLLLLSAYSWLFVTLWIQTSLQQWRFFPFYYCLLTVDCLSHWKYKAEFNEWLQKAEKGC